MTKPIIKQREYVSGRISNGVMAIVTFFTFVAAILNISISPRVPEWHEKRRSAVLSSGFSDWC